jgi:hypothetical protein
MRKVVYAWATAGVVVPLVLLLDLNVLGGFLSDYTPLVLLVWPSSFMLSGFAKVNVAAIVGLFISVVINVVLYVLVGLMSFRVYSFLKGLRREH